MNEWNTHKQKRNIFCFWFPVEPPVLCSILGKESIILLKFEHQNFDELKKKKIVFWSKSDEINRLLWTTFSTVQVIIRNNNYRSHYYLCSKSLPTIKTYGDLIVIIYDNTFTRKIVYVCLSFSQKKKNLYTNNDEKY